MKKWLKLNYVVSLLYRHVWTGCSLECVKQDFPLPEKELIERLDELCSFRWHDFHGNDKVPSCRQVAFLFRETRLCNMKNLGFRSSINHREEALNKFSNKLFVRASWMKIKQGRYFRVKECQLKKVKSFLFNFDNSLFLALAFSENIIIWQPFLNKSLTSITSRTEA